VPVAERRFALGHEGSTRVVPVGGAVMAVAPGQLDAGPSSE
jgi:hypothetical protein